MMQKLLAAAGICLMALAGPAAASTQTVITFDDVNWDVDAQSIPDGYGGVASWGFAQPRLYYDGEQNQFGANYPFGSIRFSSPVSFVGMDVNFYYGPSLIGRYSLFYQGNEVFSKVYTDLALLPEPSPITGLIWLSSDYSGPVDRVDFSSYEGVMIDNFTYAAAPVPEPGSVAMVLAGLGLVGGLARRRQVKD